MKLWIYMMEPRTRALGPFSRFALWTQGCGRRCEGCVSPDSRVMENGEVWDVRDIAELILRDPETEGITISGGEPFLQAEALRELVGIVRSRRDYGVIIYTGFTLGELKKKRDAAWDGFLDCCDILIDGPYVAELNDGKSLRGSSNQTVIPLTDRYVKYLGMYGADHRGIEFLTKEGGKTRMVGIPPRRIIEKFL